MRKLERIRTLYVVGAGIEVDPWAPVIAAIHELNLPGIGAPKLVKEAEGAVSYIGALVHSRREAARLSTLKKIDPVLRRKFKNLKRDLGIAHAEFKKAVKAKLEAATEGETIKLRHGFVSYVARQEGSCAFLTTNWDLLLEKAFAAAGTDPTKIQHVHGDVRDIETMLLPGEVSGENYRTTELAERLQWGRMTLWKVFEAADRVVIYGQSLSPLEAELKALLRLGFADPPNQPAITIVSATKSEAKIVAKRLLPILRPGVEWNTETLGGEP